jgi:hypothetical protein
MMVSITVIDFSNQWHRRRRPVRVQDNEIYGDKMHQKALTSRPGCFDVTGYNTAPTVKAQKGRGSSTTKGGKA